MTRSTWIVAAALGILAAVMTFGIFTVSSRMTPQIPEVKSGQLVVTPEQKGTMREVVQKEDCSRVVAVRVFEKRRSFSGMWYENHMLLENGRRVIKESIFIKQVGELHCELWAEYVN